MSQFYAIRSLEEARAYLEDEILGVRLREISFELLKHSDKGAESILGGIDSTKLKSCMTLFDRVSPNDVFDNVLQVFFAGRRDGGTLRKL